MSANPTIWPLALMLVAWRDVNPRTGGSVDYLGAALLSGGIVALMLALFEMRTGLQMNLFAVGLSLLIALGMLIALVFVERRAANPILPLALFRERLFVVAISHGFFAGFAMFGSAAFVPLFVQAVLGTSATMAGAMLMPQMFFWTIASIIGTRLLLRFHFRTLALTGVTVLLIGAVMLTQVSATTSQWILGISMALTGIGMGLSVPIFLIAVQSTVPRQSLGTATSTVQFSRSIGGAIGTSVMGVVLAIQLAGDFVAAGLDPAQVSVDALLDPSAGMSSAMTSVLRGALTGAVQAVFVVAFIAVICAWIAAALAPRVQIGARAPARTVEKGAPAE